MSEEEGGALANECEVTSVTSMKGDTILRTGDDSRDDHCDHAYTYTVTLAY